MSNVNTTPAAAPVAEIDVTIHVVEAPSAFAGRTCILGVGFTRRAALESAYGPGGKLGRNASVYTRTVSPGEANELLYKYA